MAEELVGIIGGSGLGDALAEQLSDAEVCAVETPFGKPSDEILIGHFGKRRIAFLNRHGRGHRLMPSEVPFAANIFALKKLGVRSLIASGAVGSLNEQIAPGDMVLGDQFIDKTFRRLGTFFTGYGAVHGELAEPVCAGLRQALTDAAKTIDIQTHLAGTYVCMEGPQFSTRAESLMHRAWGGDLIGMTAMPEAKLAREAQMCYALVALASDYDCWRPHESSRDRQSLLEEIIGNLTQATSHCLTLIEAVLGRDAPLVCEQCDCRQALELAVWTKPDQIDRAKKETLEVLFE